VIAPRVMQTGRIVVLAAYLRSLANTVGGSDVSRYRYGADVRSPIPRTANSLGRRGCYIAGWLYQMNYQTSLS
jgi:hypothetical protein